MKLQFVSYDNIDIIKSNLKSWVDNFKQDSSDWLQDELGNALFSDTKFAEIPDFSLDMSADKPFLTEAENVKRIYGNLRFLSDSQASDERLWAGLCLGPFWDYVKYRWDINKKCTVGNVQQHFFFGFGARRSLTRNALSRLWWIGRLTYDEKRSDPWELTKFVCESSDYIMHILERNTFKSCRIWVSFQFNVISSHFGNGDHILNICNRIIDSSIVAFCKFDFRSNIFGIHFFFEAYDDEAFPSLRSTIMDCVKRIFA